MKNPTSEDIQKPPLNKYKQMNFFATDWQYERRVMACYLMGVKLDETLGWATERPGIDPIP